MKDLIFAGILLISFLITFLFTNWCDRQISNKEEG